MTEKNDRISTINDPALLAIRVDLVRVHQAIGNLLVSVDTATSDNLVSCRTYINLAMKELKKIDDR